MIGELQERLKEQGLEIEATEKAKNVLVEEGFDPDFGARPLRRAIQRLVENPLSDEILAGKFKNGDKVLVDADENNKIIFNKE